MNKAEELELICHIKETNSQESKYILYNEYSMLIHKIARQYISSARNLEYQDLFEEGVLGLFYALEKYDIEKNVKFDTYAYNWIRERILAAVKTSQKKIYVPHAKSNTAHKIRKLIMEAEKLNFSHEETQMYIKSNLNVTDSKFQKIMKDYDLIELSRNIDEYDKCINVVDHNFSDENIVDIIYKKNVKESVRDAVKGLDDLEKQIILALFFQDKAVSTLKILNDSNQYLTRPEIMKIKRRAMTKLKKKLKNIYEEGGDKT